MSKVRFFQTRERYKQDQEEFYKHFNISLACSIFAALDCRVKSARFIEESGQMEFEVSWAMTQTLSTVVFQYVPYKDNCGRIHMIKGWETWDEDRVAKTGNDSEGHNLCEAITNLVQIWDRG